MMDTVRFSKIVETAGKPSDHVLWIDPAEDTILQKAIKANRVMTVHQQPGGARTDYGTVGFQKNVAGQILIFPKSLKQFADKRVIGVKYDLLESPAVPKNQQAPKPRPAERPAKSKPDDTKIPALPEKRPGKEESANVRVVKFPTPKTDDKVGPKEDIEKIKIEEIKNQVRQAMKVLEEGKHVAAFNLLQRIVDS
jgi:hypothetical protein